MPLKLDSDPEQPVAGRRLLGLFTVVLGAAFLLGLGSWGVLESSEARYAEIAREMLVSRDWLYPRLLGIEHFHKPPLTYWLTAAGLALAGPTALGVRLLPVLAVLAQVWLVYGIGKVLFAGNRRRALTAAVLYGTLPVVLISALNVTTDAYLTTLELAATFGLLRYYHTGRWWGLYLCWLALGLAFLTKGPVGFVLPLMAVVGFYFRRGQARRPFSGHHVLGVALFAVVGLSWYGFLIAENQAFLRYFLVGHTVERFVSAEAFGRAKPWWFYLVLAPASGLPWSVVLAGRALRTGWKALPQLWRNVLVFWILVPLLFFSLSQSKLVLYVLPIFPGVALLTAYHLHEMPETARRRWYLGCLACWGLLLLVLAALPWLAVPLHLTLTPMAALLPAGGLVVLLLSSWQTRHRLPATARLLLAATLFTATLLLAAKPLLRQNELALNGVRPVLELMQREGLADRPVLVYNELLSSMAFGQGRLPVSLYAGNTYLLRETQFEPTAAWHRTWLNSFAFTPHTLDSLRQQRPVLLVKGEVNAGQEWLIQPFSHQLEVGPWRLYYDW
ncbi:ArnT family glycosyltransferase [Hymenobacter psychrotolerans]|uniref:4-amino-4-deoxy-L-arabinose transferase n=1 Tax=Hymenobacter psychrotolerans DSM 18569 TaxID=1121959 RepID=A0A1M7AVL8_9BACT|nr:glycosyltransferase family 39 protein [Hymenobacter psychrotolerans]SHL46783.1 4-amino-4-deoxy-L-arabinose transferase [Hymenobacter psychrotolerans DSM 18569]